MSEPMCGSRRICAPSSAVRESWRRSRTLATSGAPGGASRAAITFCIAPEYANARSADGAAVPGRSAEPAPAAGVTSCSSISAAATVTAGMLSRSSELTARTSAEVSRSYRWSS